MTQYSTTTRTLLNVTYAQKTSTITYTTPRLAKGAKMRQQFQVVYETKGVKVVNVWLPEGTELPEQWETMNNKDKDTWLYDNQDEAHLQWTDEHEGQAVNILPVLRLKAVI